jgi:hypothetical protein
VLLLLLLLLLRAVMQGSDVSACFPARVLPRAGAAAGQLVPPMPSMTLFSRSISWPAS